MALYFFVDRSTISFASSSFVLPSLGMPNDFAATITGSCGVFSAVPIVVFAIVETFMAAFSNSRFAWPMNRAISGSFLGPQRKRSTSMTAITSPSYPIIANPFHKHGNCSVTNKNVELLMSGNHKGSAVLVGFPLDL